MSDVFDILGTDHREVKQMLAELEAGPTKASGATQPQLRARTELAEKLIIESSKHEAVEEQYFWPEVRDRITNGRRLADHAIDQETEAKRVLALLDKLSADAAEFEGLLSKYIPAAREHIAYEEDAVWPSLRGALTAAEAEALGNKLVNAKKTAPTRPHPHMPPDAGLLKTAGPAVAAADKLRDAMSGRGRR